jgi:hypothetical protein
MVGGTAFRPNPANFGVIRVDPGWLYLLRNANLFKVGKTANPKRRFLGEARTWLPDMELIAVKPFWDVSVLERLLHSGLAKFWYEGEWHQFSNEIDSRFLIDGFCKFSDNDRDLNSIDFIYRVNGSGMAELIREHNHRRISLRQWQREAGAG